jgi:signal transduction histidine kinase
MNSLSVFEATRLNLARLTVQGQQELQRGFEQAAQASAHALQVARVGVWFLSRDAGSLVCACQWGPEGTSSRATLPLSAMPRYLDALLSRRVVMAHDALSAPETRELASGYLLPNQITSLLDAPIYRLGEVIGVVCHEHVGPPRTWTIRERDFATSVAEILEVLLEQAGRAENERALHQQRERSERLEREALLSRFAAGIAHDFNNILTAVSLQIEFAQRRAGEPARADLAEALQFIDAAQGLVAQIKNHCKDGPFAPRRLHLVHHLQKQQRLLEVAAGKDHALSFAFGQERAILHADPTQLNQMVLNLVLNARDAMPQGGCIRVEVDTTDDWITLAVVDQGVGMDEETRARIFEPFFSTKGTGTGLGLSTAQEIVRRHGGQIEVESSPGAGTRFLVRLPRVEG